MGSFGLSLSILLASFAVFCNAIFINSTGCQTTKMCLFRPKGCDPNLDCTIGLVLSTVGPNQMKVQMVAATIVPPVQQQYVAVAFSYDTLMGNDTVSECVLSNMGESAGNEPEVYLSYNKGKTNDRVFLNDDEHDALFSDVAGEIVDTRLVCEFTQRIMPQIDNKHGLVWNLDTPWFVMVATGSAQPDEVNVHELNRDSHSFPITSEETFNPITFGNNFDHPSGFTPTTISNRVETRPTRPTEAPISSSRTPLYYVSLLSLLFLF